VDSAGQTVVIGTTHSSDIPVTSTAFEKTPTIGSKASDGFVIKLSADGSYLVGATYIGGSDFEELSGVAVDSASRVYHSGNTPSADYPLTPNAFQKNYQGGRTDGVFCVFSPDLSTLLYSTYLGSGGNDRGRGMWLAPSGKVLISGDCGTGFPATQGVVQRDFSDGNTDAWVMQWSPNFE